jgi:hypothetical protein
MKRLMWTHLLIGGLMSCAGLAESHPEVAPAESPTNRSQPRPASEGLPSEDRSPRAKESREAQGRGGAPRAEAKKRHEEWEKLSPEERRAAFREWRQKREGEGQLSAPEREARRRVMRERLARQLGELRQKQADSALTEEERNRLERLEEIGRRFEREGWTNGGSALRRPGETLPKPDRKSENSAPSRAPHP